MNAGGFSSGDPDEDNKTDEEDHLVDVQAGTGLETAGTMPPVPAPTNVPPTPSSPPATPPAPTAPDDDLEGPGGAAQADAELTPQAAATRVVLAPAPAGQRVRIKLALYFLLQGHVSFPMNDYSAELTLPLVACMRYVVANPLAPDDG